MVGAMLGEVAGYVGLLHEPVVQDDLVEAATEIVDLGPPGRRTTPITSGTQPPSGILNSVAPKNARSTTNMTEHTGTTQSGRQRKCSRATT